MPTALPQLARPLIFNWLHQWVVANSAIGTACRPELTARPDIDQRFTFRDSEDD